MLEIIKLKAKQLRKQIITVYLAYRHKEVKWYIKVFLLLILVYALSPIDLIPDFIPVLGMLDDLILIPMGVYIAIKIIPKGIWEDCQKDAENGVTIDRNYKKIGAALIILIWGIVLISVIRRVFF